ncbi:amino acid permease [Arsenicicoccus sp. oral taxon 190]|uniref:amino acid permease n=1 Tax=Arsenicicoccus sp. oral taxon 190 TaxID=1658671 RepID=UPI0009E22471|nr:amino acid permease [Arsenicicoccus sp. oral taxon 190]
MTSSEQSQTQVATEPEPGGFSLSDSGDEGYHQSLTNRQVQMIAIGGAIGVGLFMGAGGRLAKAGPSLVLAYAGCGVIAYLLMRALGELVMHRTSSGSFVSYSREFFGNKWAFVAGWMYMVNWMTSGIAEITAIAQYVNKWLPDLPQWIPALVALAVVLSINLISVKAFGEFEFWASMVKVVALITFIVVGIGLVATRTGIAGHEAGLGNLVHGPGGFFPAGVLPLVMVMQGVIFAYATIELVGTASGETENAREVIPKAIRAVIFRIAFFYVGSVLLLGCLLPYTMYHAGESPFVTVFSNLGQPWIGDAMNVVVLTAALSSCNSGLYSTGRVLRSLAAEGEAPAFTGRMNKHHVPYGGILLTASVYGLGVFLNYVVPARAFELALNMAAIGVMWTWGTIFACQIALRRRIDRGELPATTFPMPGAPVTSWLGLAALCFILVTMAFDPDGQLILACTPVVVAALVAGWFAVRRKALRSHALHAERTGR